MTKDEANAIVITELRNQLRLAISYIRNHIDGMSGFDDSFMSMFADTCEDVGESATCDAVLVKYKLLAELHLVCRPYFNYLNHIGQGKGYFPDKIRQVLCYLQEADSYDEAVGEIFVEG